MALEGSGERTAPRRKSTRQPVSQRDTYRHYTEAEVSAQPVDAYASPGGVSQRTKSLIKAVEQGRGLLGNYAEFKTQQRKEDKQEGYELGKIGKEPEEGASESKIKGFLQAKGEGDTFDFEQEIHKHLQENWQQDPESFQEGINKTIENYTEGKSEEYLKGFVPKAEQVEQKYYKQYMEAQQEKVREDGLNNLTKSFQQDFQDIREIDDQEKQSKKMRQILSETQKKGSSFGLSRDEVTSRIINTVGREAELKADPDMLNFVDEPDEQGVRLTSTKHQQEIRTWKERAKAAELEEEQNKEARVKEYRTRAKDQIEREFMVQALQADRLDKDTLRNMQQDLLTKYSNPDNNEYGVALDARDIKTYSDMIDHQMELEGFSDTSNHDLVANMENWVLSSSTKEDFQAAEKMLYAQKGQMTPDDYKRLNRKLAQERSQMDNTEYNENKNRVSSYISKSAKHVQTQPNPFAFDSEPEKDRIDSLRVADYQSMMQEEIANYKQDNDGQLPSTKELREMSKDIGETVKNRHPIPEDDSLSVPTGSNDTSSMTPALEKEMQSNQQGQGQSEEKSSWPSSPNFPRKTGPDTARQETARQQGESSQSSDQQKENNEGDEISNRLDRLAK